MALPRIRFPAFLTDFFQLNPPLSSDAAPPTAPSTLTRTPADPTHEENASGLSPRAIKAVKWFQETFKEQLTRISKPGDGGGVAAIDMMTAENWLCRDVLVPMYQETVLHALTARHLSYAPGFGGDPALLDAAAAFYNAFFAPKTPVRPEHVVVGAGCSALLAHLVHDVCEEGEGVLVEVPYWGGFEMECIMRAKVEMVPVRSATYYAADESDPAQLVEHYTCAIRSATCPVRALLLCNPHNPRGRLYSATELTALVDFCHANQLHLISDEIYGLSVFSTPSVSYSPATTTFTPVMGLALPDPSRVHTLHGISKDFGSSGLRLGFIVTQANPLLRMSLAISNHAKVSTVSTLMAKSLLANQNRLPALLSTTNAALRDAAAVVVNFLVARDVPFHQPVAGVFIWARLYRNATRLEDEVNMSKAFRTAGVEIVAGRSCREPQPGWFRVTFALPREELLLGLERIASVLDVFNDKHHTGGAGKGWGDEWKT